MKRQGSSKPELKELDKSQLFGHSSSSPVPSIEQVLAHLQRLLEGLHSLLAHAQVEIRLAHGTQRAGHIGVVAVEQGLAHLQRILVELQLLLVHSRVSVRRSHSVERPGHIGVIAGKQGLAHS